MKAREFIPREHGAWAMWIVPMLSAALVTHFTFSFLILFVCFALLYVVHHPIVTLAKRHWNWQDGEKRLVGAFAAPAVLLGAILVLIYHLPWLLSFGGLELGLFVFSVRTFLDREQRTFFNELTIVAALTLSAPVGYYTITHAVDTDAVILYVLNFLFFGSSVFYVKMRIEFLRTKGAWVGEAGKARAMAIVYHILLVIIIILINMSGHVRVLLLLGFAPMLIQVAIGIFSRQTRMNFTRLGIALIIQSVIFLSAVGLFWR